MNRQAKGLIVVLLCLLVSPIVHAGTDIGFFKKFQAENDVEKRIQMIFSLEKQPSESARKILEAIASDNSEEPEVRMQAVCSLGSSATRKSVPVLTNILETDLNERHGYWACAIPQLGGLKDRRAIPLLLRIANLGEDHLAGMDHMAIEALAKLGDEREVKLLTSKAYIPPVRLAVIQGLARIASIISADVLIEALQEAEEPEIVDAARSGLLKIGTSALPALKKALSESTDRKARSRMQKIINRLQ